MGKSTAGPMRAEQLKRLLFREFLLEPDLYHEAGLERLPEELGELLGCPADQAIGQGAAEPFLANFELERLQQLLAIRDMTLTSRTAAAVAAELKDPAVDYDACCRRALCYAVAGLYAHATAALRAAAAKHGDWARHHYLLALMLGQEGPPERAMEELHLALQHEPYEDGRIRIRRAIDVIEGRT
jgi:tetratricopeptide (TPR) repeat protein